MDNHFFLLTQKTSFIQFNGDRTQFSIFNSVTMRFVKKNGNIHFFSFFCYIHCIVLFHPYTIASTHTHAAILFFFSPLKVCKRNWKLNGLQIKYTQCEHNSCDEIDDNRNLMHLNRCVSMCRCRRARARLRMCVCGCACVRVSCRNKIETGPDFDCNVTNTWKKRRNFYTLNVMHCI